jgi:hypothetical protein
VQVIVADFAKLEQFEQQAQRAIDEIDRTPARQTSEIPHPTARAVDRVGGAGVADCQRRWDAAAVDLQASLVELP